jgi:hypothetical protein
MQSFLLALLYCGVCISHAKYEQTAAIANSNHKEDSVTTYRQSHRWSLDGQLCAAAFEHNSNMHVGCSSALDPNGNIGREWCYLEEQIAKGSDLNWGYCETKIDFQSLRAHAAISFQEQAYELAATTSVMVELGKEAAELLRSMSAKCDIGESFL